MPIRIGRRGHRFHEFEQVFATAHQLELVHGFKFGSESHQVNRRHIAVKRAKGSPNQLMLFQVEKAFVLNDHDGITHHVRIAQNTSKQATFSIQVHGDLTAFV